MRGPIQEASENTLFGGKTVIPANEVVKRVQDCEEKDYDAIIVNIDSPGGAPVPSDDIRQVLEDVDTPTFTYTRSLCASGGYMIACGTDWIHGRQDSLIGSIGVIANQYKFTGLAEQLGVKLERFVGGEYKDTHRPLKELDEGERQYWQDVIDTSYENFVDLVAESRELSQEDVKATKAKVLHANDALETGLIDEVGSRQDFKDQVKEQLDLEELCIRRYDGGKDVFGTVDTVLSRMAYSFGKGLSSALGKSDRKLEYRMR